MTLADKIYLYGGLVGTLFCIGAIAYAVATGSGILGRAIVVLLISLWCLRRGMRAKRNASKLLH